MCESKQGTNNEFSAQQYSEAGDSFFLFCSLVITKNDNSAALDIKYLLRVSAWTLQMSGIKCFSYNTNCLKARRQGTWPHSPDCLSLQVKLIFSFAKTRTLEPLASGTCSYLCAYLLLVDDELLGGSDIVHGTQKALSI